MKALLLPVKTLSAAKTRQDGFLTAAERVQVAKAMLIDVTRSIRESRARRVFLVSGDPWALLHGRRQGWDVLAEESQISESASIDWASRHLARSGFSHALRIPGDVPLMQPSDLDSLLAWDVPTPGALIVPSREGSGTNALLRSPPDLFPSRFGPNSFFLHLEEARRRGVRAIVTRNDRISLDLDEPADLERFLHLGEGTETRRVLEEIGVKSRLSRHRP